MTATLDVLPGTRLIAVPHLRPAQRAIRLARLAADVLEQPGRLPASDVAVLLSAYASDSLHGNHLAEAWTEYLDAIRLEDDTDTGFVTWQQVEPELTCCEPQEAAREMTRASVRDALNVLVNGEKELGGSKLTALALREDQAYWDDNQLAVLRSNGIDEGVTRAELQTFLHECQRRRLDPFTRQIYLIGRWDKRQKRKVYRSQTSIDGFRLIARRAADKAGIDYSYEDTIWFDASGERHEIWLADKPPAGAKVVVVRNGCRYDAEARFSEYVQVNDNSDPVGQWKSMPATMIAKCCEALALRKAFPEDLGGLYTEEEMAQADNPQVIRATAEILREEPADPARHAADGPAEQPAGPDESHEDLLSSLTVEATTFAVADTGRAVYRKVTAMSRDRKITRDDAKRLHELIVARIGDMQKAETEAEVIEGTIVADLDPEDPWAAKVETVTSEGDAEDARADVRQQVKSGRIPQDRADIIIAAIDARAASLGSQVAA